SLVGLEMCIRYLGKQKTASSIAQCLVGSEMCIRDSSLPFFQAEDGIRDRSVSRGLGDVYKRQDQ
ncbi:hypothetical protein, partial [Staphylococcus aureus]